MKGFIKACLLGLLLIVINQTCFSLPFNIFPKAGTTLPGSVVSGLTATAYYTVQNKTGSTRVNNFVKYLPPNVTQVTAGGTYGDTCGATFTLTAFGTAGDSCTLQLTISGVVNSSDPDPQHHLFVCMPGGISCAGTHYPLNVVGSTLLSIIVTPANPSVPNGATQQFTATGQYSGGQSLDITSSVTWSSSNPAVATITSGGLAMAVASSGTSTITATLGTVSGSTTLTANAATLVSIAVTPPNPNVPNGTTQQFTATGTYSDASTHDITTNVTWASGNMSVATITSGGLATAVASSGTSTISATQGVISGSTTLTATAPILVSIAVTPTSASIIVGATQQFTATGTFSDSSTQNLTNTANWNSTNTGVATISATGLATGVSAGTTNITASSGSVTSNTAVLTVTQPSFAYVGGNTFLRICPVNADGTFGTCTDPGFAFYPDMTFNGDKTRIYGINGSFPSEVRFCTVNSDGSLTGCASASPTLNHRRLAINPTSTFVYIEPNGGGLVYCPIAGGGTFGACTSTGSGLPSNDGGITVNPAATFLYITGASNGLVYVCPINGDGSVGACSTTGNGFGISASANRGVVNSSNTFAYFTVDTPANSVRFCTVNGDGTLTGCSNTGSGFSNPEGICFNTGETRSYVASPTNNIVRFCSVNGNGTFGSCSNATTSIASPELILVK